MNISFILLVVLELMLVFLIAFILYVLFFQDSSYSLEKRFNKYTINDSDTDKTPAFEKIFDFTFSLISNLSKILEKRNIIKKYSIKYDKYVDNDSKYLNNSINYISIKLLVSVCISFLYIISTVLRMNFSFILMLLIFIISFILMDLFYNIDYKIKRKRIEEDLLSAIIIMNNAFKSGMNITEAVKIVSSQLDGPIKNEFIKINNDIKYGLGLEVAFDRFYDRVKIEDIKYISSSLSLINKTGGNIVKVFNSIEKNFYDKKRIKNELKSLTSSSNFMFKLLLFMPIFLIIVLLLLNKNYFLPLINSHLGIIILFVVLIMYILYIIIVKLIMKVKYYE